MRVHKQEISIFWLTHEYMYNLVHTHTKSKIAYALNFVTYTFYVCPHYQVSSKLGERYHNSCNSQEK